MRKILFCVALVGVVAAVAGCGTTTTTTTNAAGQVTTVCHTSFAKTKFLLHSGLAFGAFHRYIYRPYRAGAFRKGAPGRAKALVKAGASAVFAYHELKVAANDAKCDGPALRRLGGSLSGVLGALQQLRALKAASGLGAIGTAGALLDKLGRDSSHQGAPIKDVQH